ncbi:MAG: hydroxyacylglutathione hydrolase [Rhodobiaceae bacterium]|nr:hydroxyacylglutathione hydrolase [Rhodobiaceae bacterium]MCC0056818.1 hydroxyacylglutathione hydrolase [Rhodobiaceae bacterium]
MPKLDIHLFPALDDNYGVLIHDAGANVTASIDAPDAKTVEKALRDTGWSLTHILVTHHHADHTQGITALKSTYGCRVIGPKGEAEKIPGIDEALAEGDVYRFGNFDVEVLETPGHTLGHITLYLPAAKIAFCGDTVFPLGCGRVFEGTMDQMWSSVAKIGALPADTALYCGHEYTLSNARFAETVETGNGALKDYIATAKTKRERGEPTVPTTVKAELAANPFLRADRPELAAAIGMAGASAAEVFGEIRRRKDNF